MIKTCHYYDLPNEKEKQLIFHKTNYDSIIYYYDNGRVFKTGKKDLNGNLYDKWNYYTKDGFLSDTREYFLLNNKFNKGYRLNQIWYFNQKGDTMYYGNNSFNKYNQKDFFESQKNLKRSIFIRFDLYPKEDTLNITEPFRGYAEDGFPFWTNNNSECYIVLAKEKYNFNKDFSNEEQVKLDTFFCLEKDKVNKKAFHNANQKHTVVFGRWFDNPGKKILRGYMVEFYRKKSTLNDSIVKQERRTYFEKTIYVKR